MAFQKMSYTNSLDRLQLMSSNALSVEQFKKQFIGLETELSHRTAN
jgi:hypothetical protein